MLLEHRAGRPWRSEGAPWCRSRAEAEGRQASVRSRALIRLSCRRQVRLAFELSVHEFQSAMTGDPTVLVRRHHRMGEGRRYADLGQIRLWRPAQGIPELCEGRWTDPQVLLFVLVD